MRQLDSMGHSIVMSVHDEVVIESPDDVSLDVICRRMSETPSWAPGLMLRADGFAYLMTAKLEEIMNDPDAWIKVLTALKKEREDEYPALGRMVAKEIGIDMFDDTTYEPSRLMYWPSTPSDGEFVFKEKNGELLDPDVYLGKYQDWRGTSMWPTSKRQSEVMKRSLKQQKDPLAKEGVVGAFCRAYPIENAIETFLADIYEPSKMAGRFDYIPADSSAGVVMYEGKFAYSHHATDPVCGKLLNAFDLVRLHKFGELDEKASFKAMADFAVKDERVKKQLAEERRAQAEADFTDEDNWQTQLELDKSGAVKDTLTNISIILRFDPNLKPIVFNQFKNMIDVIGKLPWPQVKPGWSDTDLARHR
jgi:hypothetical protein